MFSRHETTSRKLELMEELWTPMAEENKRLRQELNDMSRTHELELQRLAVTHAEELNLLRETYGSGILCLIIKYAAID